MYVQVLFQKALNSEVGYVPMYKTYVDLCLINHKCKLLATNYLLLANAGLCWTVRLIVHKRENIEFLILNLNVTHIDSYAHGFVERVDSKDINMMNHVDINSCL